MTYEEWLDYGYRRGYCTSPFCDTHDGAPYTADEFEALDRGEDPCVVALRVDFDPKRTPLSFYYTGEPDND